MTLCTYIKTGEGCAVLGADSFLGNDDHFQQSEKIHRYGKIFLMESGDESHIESVKRRIDGYVRKVGSASDLRNYLESWDKKHRKRAFLEDVKFIFGFLGTGEGVFYHPDVRDLTEIESYESIGSGKESADTILSLLYRANSWRRNPPSTADAVKATLYSFYASIGRDTAVKPPVNIVIASKEPKEFLVEDTSKAWRKVVRDARNRFKFRGNGNNFNILGLLEETAGQL